MELTLDEKLECVLLHLNGNLPLHTISKKRGINVINFKIKMSASPLLLNMF